MEHYQLPNNIEIYEKPHEKTKLEKEKPDPGESQNVKKERKQELPLGDLSTIKTSPRHILLGKLASWSPRTLKRCGIFLLARFPFSTKASANCYVMGRIFLKCS